MAPRVRLTVWSDYVCPFCYLEEPILARIHDEYRDHIDVNWQAFALRRRSDERRLGFLFLGRIVHLGICRAGSYRCGQREIRRHGSIGLSVLLCLWRCGPQDHFDLARQGEYAGFNSHLRKVARQFPHIEVHPEIWLKTCSPTSASAHLFMTAVQHWQQERGREGQSGSATSIFDKVMWAFSCGFFRHCRDIARWDVQCELAEALGVVLANGKDTEVKKLAQDIVTAQEKEIVAINDRQRRPASASCAGLQARQLHADAGIARGCRALVADQPQGEAREDRRQDRHACPVRHLPDGRGRGAEGIVPGNPAAYRRTTTKTGPSVGTGTVECIITAGGPNWPLENGA